MRAQSIGTRTQATEADGQYLQATDAVMVLRVRA